MASPGAVSNQIVTIRTDPYVPVYGGNMLDPGEFDQIIREEGGRGVAGGWNWDLFKIYEDIERDCHAFAVLQSRYMAVIRREWHVEPASTSRRDKRNAEMVDRMLRAMGDRTDDQEKGQTLVTAGTGFDGGAYWLLSALLYGFSGSEVMWDKGGGEIFPKELRGRRQRRFGFITGEQGYLARLRTRLNQGNGEPIPPRKVIFHHHQVEYGPYGRGLGHRLFWPTFFKRTDVKWWLIFAEKFAAPTSMVRYPDGATPEQKNAALDIALQLSTEAGVAMPVGMAVELLEAQRSGTISTYEGLAAWCDSQISEAVLGQTGTTNQQGSGGSRARDEVAERVSLHLSKYDADLLAATFNRTLIRWIVHFNIGPDAALPKLWWKFPELEDRPDLTSLVQVHKTLFDMEFKPTRKFVEETYDVELEEEKPEPAAAGGGLLAQLFGGGDGAAAATPPELSEALDFARLKIAGNTRQAKECKKGYPCGFTCISKNRSCRQPLEGQAKDAAEWLRPAFQFSRLQKEFSYDGPPAWARQIMAADQKNPDVAEDLGFLRRGEAQDYAIFRRMGLEPDEALTAAWTEQGNAVERMTAGKEQAAKVRSQRGPVDLEPDAFITAARRDEKLSPQDALGRYSEALTAAAQRGDISPLEIGPRFEAARQALTKPRRTANELRREDVDLADPEQRLAFAKQELARAKREGTPQQIREWEQELSRAQRAALAKTQQQTRNTQQELFGIEVGSSLPLFANMSDAEAAAIAGFVDLRGPAPGKATLKKARKCTKGYSCGSTCISKARVCRKELAERERQAADYLRAKVATLEAELSRARQDLEAAAKPAAPQPGDVRDEALSNLNFDPKRFQYKLLPNETGATGSLTDVRRWDPNLAGVVQVWIDPGDGNTYVINGHNRASLANKLGVERITVRYINAKDASEARAIGALTNIAEGRGDALDSAKFFRDTGLTRDDLIRRGIPMRERIATEGLALAGLDDSLFRRVVDGRLPIQRAAVIGGSGLDHDQQRALVEMIEKRERGNRRVTNDTIAELVDVVKSSTQQTEFTMDLFGGSETTRSLAFEKAELQSRIRQRLSREKKLFGTVSRSTAAQELARGGNQINTARSGEIASQASATLAVFDQFKSMAGPISRQLNSAAERIANGENKSQVEREIYGQIVDAIANQNYEEFNP